MTKKNLYLFEISDVLASQAKLPYSTGLIWSYCLEEEKIPENYNLANWFWYKDDDNTVDAIFEKIENPSIIGLATFIWNWKWNKKYISGILSLIQLNIESIKYKHFFEPLIVGFVIET